MKRLTYNTSIAAILLALIFGSLPTAFAQQGGALGIPAGTEDPTQSSFKIIICDGPALPSSVSKPAGYIPCDFNGAMLTVQHLINIMMVLGVLAAIILFTYAGYLMMTGKDSDRSKAKDIFPKVFFGFIIMLSAWFIVYQLLSWLTGNGMFTKLLGNP